MKETGHTKKEQDFRKQFGMPNTPAASVFHDIKLIPDSEVDERVNFIIKCENKEQMEQLFEFFQTSRKQVSFNDIQSRLKAQNKQLRF